MSLNVKAGDKVKHKYGNEYTVEIVGADGKIAIKNSFGDVFIIKNGEDTKYYEKVSTFFKVGKTYRFNSSTRTDTWTIQSVHELDRPNFGESKWKAVAIMTTKSGYQDLQTLSVPDFERMIEA